MPFWPTNNIHRSSYTLEACVGLLCDLVDLGFVVLSSAFQGSAQRLGFCCIEGMAT